MAIPPTIVWFRQDLRLQDNPALNAAVARGGAILPIYILDDAAEERWAMGAASRWWLHHSLAALEASLRKSGSRLTLAVGDSTTILKDLVRTTQAGAIFWNRRYEPTAMARDARLRDESVAAGVEVRTFNSSLLHEPDEIQNRQGRPFQIFTAYWRHCRMQPTVVPVKLGARRLPAPAKWPRSRPLAELNLLPKVRWDAGFAETWRPGEAQAATRLRDFVARKMERYAEDCDRPDRDGTSMLSPHLHFGEISPRQIWAAVRQAGQEAGVFPPGRGATAFLSELGWREFAHHVLWHFPESPERPLRKEFARFPWVRDPRGRKLRAWERGRTGYPIVDAGLRQLWHLGWMHNRVRMIVASFFVKDLRLPWIQGAGWFWETLVDADLANNSLGWQWSAGCGVDATPYFRIFAPVRQGKKFDPDGEYVRRWVPELRAMPSPWIHEPWSAPATVLESAGVKLGENYPQPLVDHVTAREDALAAFREMQARTRL